MKVTASERKHDSNKSCTSNSPSTTSTTTQPTKKIITTASKTTSTTQSKPFTKNNTLKITVHLIKFIIVENH